MTGEGCCQTRRTGSCGHTLVLKAGWPCTHTLGDQQATWAHTRSYARAQAGSSVHQDTFHPGRGGKAHEEAKPMSGCTSEHQVHGLVYYTPTAKSRLFPPPHTHTAKATPMESHNFKHNTIGAKKQSSQMVEDKGIG